MLPLVHIVIVSYNSLRHLETMLPRLLRTNYPHYFVMVVDNASQDGSPDFVAQNFQSFTVLRNAENVGFARANNSALERAFAAGADYVVLLNPDIEILDDEWLRRAVDAAESGADVGMIGFQMVHHRESIPSTHSDAQDVQRIDGCALLIRTAMLQNIGTFDPGYFLYGEEDDLEFRAHEAGYRLQRINVPVFHEHMGSAKTTPARSVYYAMWGGLRLRVKTRGLFAAVKRSIKLFDVACSPFPLTFRPDSIDDVRLRMVNKRGLAFVLWCCAVARTIVYLPDMYATRQRELFLMRTRQFQNS